jgi:cell division protein FtsL
MSLLDMAIPQIKAAKWIIGGLIVAAIGFSIWLFYNNYNNAITKIAQQEIAMQAMQDGINKQQTLITNMQNDIKEIGALRDHIAENDKKLEAGFRDT